MKYRINAKWPKATRDFIRAITKTLENVDGEINDEYGAQLDLIARNHMIILQSQEDIDTDGLFTRNRFGDKIANPAVKVLNDAQIQLQKLMIEFSLTKKAQLKHGEMDTADDMLNPSIMKAVVNFNQKGKNKKETR